MEEAMNPAQQEAMRQAEEAAAKAQEEAKKMVKEQQKEAAKGAAGEMAKSMTERELNRVVSQALPDEVNALSWGGLRSIPVIGSIVQWIDNIQWIRNLFGGGKK